MDADYERLLAVKPEVLVYQLPPRPSNRGHRAADWGLDKPSWTGRMKIVALGSKLTIRLEDRTSGALFAKSVVDAYPGGVAVESVLDSSRYFVVKIVDDNGRSAFVGVGFADRGDSFDFNVALRDHFNSLKKDKEIENVTLNQTPLNLQLKEGQTLKINLEKVGLTGQGAARPKINNAGMGGIFLPPPPCGAAKHSTPVVQSEQLPWGHNQPTQQQTNRFEQSDWTGFTTASAGGTDLGWVQF